MGKLGPPLSMLPKHLWLPGAKKPLIESSGGIGTTHDVSSSLMMEVAAPQWLEQWQGMQCDIVQDGSAHHHYQVVMTSRMGYATHRRPAI